MSNYYYGPALDSELGYRRSVLLRDAATHRLARQARRAARETSSTGGRPAVRLVPATASAPTPTAATRSGHAASRAA